MSVFGDYSRYYDLIYKVKDYEGEAAFIAKLLKEHVPKAESLLELGCGTGKHAMLLNDRGYHIDGVDLSAEMVELANERSKAEGKTAVFQGTEGDVRTVRTGKTYDAVISLFHVLSYQNSNADVLAYLDTAASHLESGGVFICDYWYGPAVLHLRPEVRVQEFENDEFKIRRLVQPELYPSKNLVDVNYTIIASHKQENRVNEVEETHTMRYIFEPELELFAQQAGFSVQKSAAWMSNAEPGLTTWGVYSVLIKK